MTDGAFPDRLAQLRSRWESDPSSRIFLQLAEEYRHQGRVREALEVLERGLKEHPGYLSALVAKGRCLLELGEPEPSRVVLERVVKQDATQMVANKLLVRAYIETSEPEKARERLDLYTLLNDSDPEIEELRRRLRTMDQPSQAENPRPPAAPGRPLPPPPPAPSRTAGDDIFDLGRPAAPRPPRPAGDVFELDPPAPRAVAPAVREAEPFAGLWAPAPVVSAPMTAPVAVLEEEPKPAEAEEPEPADVLFPGLASRDRRRRYLAGLAAEDLFHLDLTAEAVEPPPVAVEEPEPLAAVEVAPQPEAPAAIAAEPAEPLVFDLEETTPWAPPPAPEVSTPPAPAPPVAAAPEPIATATLGELYLRQGYPAEAERIFREVLSREPESAAAREGLEKLAQPAVAGISESAASRPLDAHGLLAGYQPGGRSGEAEGRARKAFLLKSYLERIRRGGQRDVS